MCACSSPACLRCYLTQPASLGICRLGSGACFRATGNSRPCLTQPASSGAGRGGSDAPGAVGDSRPGCPAPKPPRPSRAGAQHAQNIVDPKLQGRVNVLPAPTRTAPACCARSPGRPERRRAARAQVEFFRFKDDQKRALLSRLLQRRCVSLALGLPWGRVHIKRTKAKKPFAVGAPARPHAPNFNFNVSHEVRAGSLYLCVRMRLRSVQCGRAHQPYRQPRFSPEAPL